MQVIAPGGVYDVRIRAVSSEYTDMSFLESTASSLSEQNWRVFTEALRGILRVAATLFWPNT